MAEKRAGRLHQPGASETPWIIALAFIAGAVLLCFAWVIAVALDPTVTAEAETTNPLQTAGHQLQGGVAVGTTQLWLFGLFVVVLALVGLLLAWALRKQSTSRSRIDHLASKMSRARDFESMTGKSAQAEAQRFGVEDGVSLGKLVNDGKRMFAGCGWARTWVRVPGSG